MTSALAGGLIVAAVAGCLAVASDVSGGRAFLGRWLVCAAAVAGLLSAGAVLGMVAYSAMCAGPWICRP